MVVDGSNPESPHDDMVTESLDQSIALELEQIENGSHPTLLKAIEGVKKKKNEYIWTINTWKEFQIQSITKQVEALLQQAENEEKEGIENEKKKLIVMCQERKKKLEEEKKVHDENQDLRRKRRRGKVEYNNTEPSSEGGESNFIIEFSAVEKLTQKEINEDISFIQQSITTL